MDQQRATLQFIQRDELHATPVGRALWQSVRRRPRGRVAVPPVAEARGPYETSYAIDVGYPGREIVLP